MSRMLIYMTPFVLLLIPLGITIKNHKDSKILKVVEQNIKRIKLIWLFVIEWILATASVLSGLRYLSYWWDDRKFSIVSLILIVVFVYTFCVYFYYLFKRMKDRIDLLFVLFMIPIGISFMFVMLPDYVPDEQSHFQRTYLVSNLNLKTMKYVYIDSDYSVQQLRSYSDVFNNLGFNFHPSYTLFEEASGYDVLVYLIPGIAIGIGKILHLSLYTCYYLGRMANLALFISVASYSIKITPKLKKCILCFCFNPMLIQLAASYSSDCSIIAACILSVAYFLYLFDKEKIETKDIMIVCSLIIFIFLTKYVYLPIFGIYFGVISQLLRISKQQMKLILCFVFSAIILFLISNYLKKFMTTTVAFKVYYETAHVDSSQQIQFLLEDKMNIFRMLYHTIMVKKDFYLSTMVSNLGWLTIQIPKLSYYLFFVSMIFATCTESVKHKLGNRFWYICVVVIEVALIILGMYLYWTTVGSFVTEGVQGRYFLPLVLLLCVALSNGLLNKFNRIYYFIPFIILVDIPTIYSIIHFFNIVI